MCFSVSLPGWLQLLRLPRQLAGIACRPRCPATAQPPTLYRLCVPLQEYEAFKAEWLQADFPAWLEQRKPGIDYYRSLTGGDSWLAVWRVGTAGVLAEPVPCMLINWRHV